MMPDRVRGPGGFPNISARTGKICFVGTLTAQGLKLDIEYVEAWSLLLDLRILIGTIPALIRQPGR